MRDGTLFIQFLSDFWTTVWTDRKLLVKAVGAQVELLQRLYLQAVRVAAPDFIDQLPIFREDFWHLITLAESAAIDVAKTKYRLDARYETVPFLYNKVFNPTKVLREGVDYTITKDVPVGANDSTQVAPSVITFTSNPFADATMPIAASGTDKLLAFFAPKVLVDQDDLYRLFGHLVNIVQPSSEQYRQLIKGALSLYAHGPKLFLMNAGLNMAAGYPVSRDFDRVTGITNNATHYVIRTEKGVRYDIPLVATLSVQVNSKLRPFSTFITDIRLMDHHTVPEWWKGGRGNTNPEFRIVNYIPPEMAPELDAAMRDDPEVIDYLFEQFFKTHTFGMQVNTLAVQNFDAIEAFYKLVFDVKPSHTSPYINSFFKAELLFELPEEDPEVHSLIELMAQLDTGSDRDDADYWSFPPDVVMNSELVLNADPSFMTQSNYDRPALSADIDLDEPVQTGGGQFTLGGLTRLGGGGPLDSMREHVNITATIELEDEVDTPTEVVGIFVTDEDTNVTTQVV
jgi:hypothetical protein